MDDLNGGALRCGVLCYAVRRVWMTWMEISLSQCAMMLKLEAQAGAGAGAVLCCAVRAQTMTMEVTITATVPGPAWHKRLWLAGLQSR